MVKKNRPGNAHDHGNPLQHTIRGYDSLNEGKENRTEQKYD
jgi:hypothetical protein